MSKFTLTSRPADDLDRDSPLSGNTIGRFDSACGAIGTSTQPCELGMQDRPAGRQRVGGRAGRRGDDQAVGAQLVVHEMAVDRRSRSSTMPASRAAADDDVVERERVEDRLAVAHRPRLRAWSALLGSYSPASIGASAVSKSPERDVGDEAEPALVDADERRVVRRELARDAEHRAVAAERRRRCRSARRVSAVRERRIARHADVLRRCLPRRRLEAAGHQRGERTSGHSIRACWCAPDADGVELCRFDAGITIVSRKERGRPDVAGLHHSAEHFLIDGAGENRRARRTDALS